MKRPVVTIIGLGVVGGSYAGALSAAGYTVYGVARTSDTLEKAKKRGMIADGGTDAAPFAAKTSSSSRSIPVRSPQSCARLRLICARGQSSPMSPA